MTNPKIQFVGSPCGHHGTYTFYKGFKYMLDGKPKILSLGEFFLLKIWQEEDIIAVGEAQLFWEDKSSGQILVSLRLYFLPENTPEGRTDEHGEHEILSLVDKVILRAEDVVHVMGAANEVKWETGLLGIHLPESDALSSKDILRHTFTPPISESLDMSDVLREKTLIGDTLNDESLSIIVLPYDKYCRIRGLFKRMEGVGNDRDKLATISALGGFLVPSRKTYLTYCKDVFEYAELEGHELLCNHLAPKLQGRPRKKKRRRHESEESESSSGDELRPWLRTKPMLPMGKQNSLIRGINKPSSSLGKYSNLPLHGELTQKNLEQYMEADFLSKLQIFMKERNLPLRVPTIGNRPLNLYKLFKRVQECQGYHVVSQKKLWKLIYEDLAGRSAPSSQQLVSSQNCGGAVGLRKHYERLILPFENVYFEEYQNYAKKPAVKRMKPMQNQLLTPMQHIHSTVEQHRPKYESAEPSVSILQPSAPSPHKTSFSVADGGSTTITLIPVGDDQTAQQTTPPTSVASAVSSERNSPKAAQTSSPVVGELTIPKVPAKKETLSSDLAKRPEITITPIPRGATGPSNNPMQLADLMSMSGALHDLAKMAEKSDRYPGREPPRKKFKMDSPLGRMNGSDHVWDSGLDKSSVNDLMSSDLLRQMSMLDESKLILPAHQSSKTISAIASLFPQTTIFPTPAPAAHQNVRTTQKYDSSRPEPILQPQSVYSQSKHVYGKPTTPSKDVTIDRVSDSSSEIEILDLRKSNDNKSRGMKNDKLEIELLDLSTRRDITVSAVSKPSSSKSSNRLQSSHGHTKPPDISLLSTANSMNNFSSPQASLSRNSAVTGANHQNNHLLAALAAQSMPPSSMPPSLPSNILQYLISNSGKTPTSGHPSHPPPPVPGAPGLPYMPLLDPSSMAAYYSMFPGLIPTSLPVSTSSSSSNAAAVQAASMAQLAQLGSLGLAVPNVPPEAMNSLGIYKNYLPSGPLPAPHFLSGLMSPSTGNSHPPGK